MQLGLYRHYKGNLYHVISVARHSETLEELIVYRALYGDYGVWIRPKAMFNEAIEYNGVSQPRFSFVHGLDVIAPTCKRAS